MLESLKQNLRPLVEGLLLLGLSGGNFCRAVSPFRHGEFTGGSSTSPAAASELQWVGLEKQQQHAPGASEQPLWLLFARSWGNSEIVLFQGVACVNYIDTISGSLIEHQLPPENKYI